MRRKEGVGKSRVVKASHPRFSILKSGTELVIKAPIGAATANDGSATIHSALSIDGHVKNNKQRTVKGLC